MANGEKRHVGRYVYETLRKKILTLDLRPGTPLDEVSLAESFKLSRSPIRDALRRLQSEGLVTVLGNRTVMVKTIEIDSLPRYMDALHLVQRSVTRLAAVLRTEHALEEIRGKNQEYLDALNRTDFPLMVEKNKEFHLRISEAGGNSYLTMFYKSLLEEGQRLIHLELNFLVSELGMIIGNDHEEIIESIAARDAERAEAAAADHAELFRKRFVDYIAANQVEDLKLGWIDPNKQEAG